MNDCHYLNNWGRSEEPIFFSTWETSMELMLERGHIDPSLETFERDIAWWLVATVRDISQSINQTINNSRGRWNQFPKWRKAICTNSSLLPSLCIKAMATDHPSNWYNLIQPQNIIDMQQDSIRVVAPYRTCTTPWKCFCQWQLSLAQWNLHMVKVV